MHLIFFKGVIVIGALLIALIYLIYIMQFLIILRALFSWFPALGLGGGKFYSLLSRLTEPILSPVKKLLYKSNAMRNLPVDISPIIAYFLLALIARLISIAII
jgi:YggT family protein